MNATNDDCELVDPPLPDARGSLPKNALLSHCEECVQVGVKRVRSESGSRGTRNHEAIGYSGGAGQSECIPYHGGDGTESIPAWHCIAGCVCGARSKWDPEKPLPRCPCGETWRWICAVAEVNGQSGDRPSGFRVNESHRNGSRPYFGQGNEPILKGNRGHADQGGSGRFFNTFSYLSKCSSSERHAGCENIYWRANKKNPFGFDLVTREEWESLDPQRIAPSQDTPRLCLNGQISDNQRAQGNVHPTVKSYRLMHWLHSLTGADKIVDLCAGSGTGMITAALDGIEWIGAEMCPEAVMIAQARHTFWSGLSFEARRAMVKEGVVLSRFEPDKRQRSLF